MGARVECRSCGQRHRDGVAFCGACGAPLDRPCAGCGHLNPGAHRYCEACGRSLVAEPAPVERRQLTILFADLAGFTRLSQRLEPEDLHRVVSGYQDLCAEAIADLGGSVAQYLGDGVLAYFGHPVAHEDDARRAVRAGLEIVRGLGALGDRLGRELSGDLGGPIHVRIAVHTGPVVVGEIGAGERRERTALGSTPNVAARLQQIARADTVVVSGDTRRLLGRAFDLEDLGLVTLKDVVEPIHAWLVLGQSGRAGAPAFAGEPGLAPLVGRSGELAELAAAWEAARGGKGGFVLVEGEAGIGKSRLLWAFRERIAADGPAWAECRCSAYHTSSAFHPVIDLLERVAGIDAADAAADRLAKLQRLVDDSAAERDDTLALFGSLLSLPVPEDARSSPEARRRRTLEALLGWLLRSARRQPMVLVLEDAHWIDPSTRELVASIADRASGAPLLVLVTQRPGTEPLGLGSVPRLVLRTLDAAETRSLVRGVAHPNELPPAMVDDLVRRTDGIPLFVEELTRAVIESIADVERRSAERDTGPVERAGSTIPTTLQDSLMARLDRLGETKRVAQLASVIGREFSLDLLQAIAPAPPASLRSAIRRLAEAGLVRERHGKGGGSYRFKHALVQETAYASLVRADRQRTHADLARALETGFPDVVSVQPEIVARHWEESGDGERAVALYERAGGVAMRRSARAEAIEHYTRAISLLPRLGDPEVRARRELALLVALGAPLVATRGYGSADVERAHLRARELCGEVQQGFELYQALSGLYLFHQARAEIGAAARHAGELLALGRGTRDPFVTAWGHFFSSVPYYYRGAYRACLDHLDRGLAVHDPGAPVAPGYVHEHDVAVSLLCYAAMTGASLGDGPRTLAFVREALAAARRSPHPFNLGFALSFAAIVHFVRGEPARTLEVASSGAEICREHDIPVYLGLSLMLRGWALARLGDADKGIVELRAGLAQASATGTRIEAPRALAVLADAQLAAGRVKEALDAVASGLAISEQKETHYWDAELLRLRGEALLLQDRASDADAAACFERALHVARDQEALGLELRVALSEAVRLRTWGDDAGAAALLAPLAARFDPGDDLPDLRAARTLLGALA